MKRHLQSFGIHEDEDGIRHLFQDLCPDGFNYVGIRSGCGMTTRKLRFPCPHAVVPTLGLRPVAAKHWKSFLTFINDPFVASMLPIPVQDQINPTPVYIEEEGLNGKFREYLSCLERLAAPMIRSVVPLWSVNLAAFKKELSKSNIQPLVLTEAKLEDAEIVNKLLEFARTSPRKLVIIGSREVILPKDKTRLRSNLARGIQLDELIALPMEHIGAEIIKRYCQRQPIDCPIGLG